MIHFSDLPNEIQRTVVSFIQDEECLWSVCLVSKGLSEMATPLLYRVYIPVNESQCRKFLTTIQERPDLATHVRAVQLFEHPNRKGSRNREFEGRSAVPYEQLVTRGVRDNDVDGRVQLDEKEERKKMQSLGDRNERRTKAQVALLLCELARLEILVVEDLRLLLQITEALGLVTSGFSRAYGNLRRLQVVAWGEWGPVHRLIPRLMGAILSITALRYSAYLPSGPAGIMLVSPVASSNVTQLCFLNSQVRAFTLRLIVKACRSLQSFDYVSATVYKPESQFQLRDVIEILVSYHENTLEYLRLDLTEEWQRDQLVHFDCRHLIAGNLSEFKRLRVLEVGQRSLLGVLHTDPRATSDHGSPQITSVGSQRLAHVLPSSLENLKITDCDERVISHVEELLAVKSERYHRLRSVELTFTEECVKDQQIVIDLRSEFVKVVLEDEQARARRRKVSMRSALYLS